MSEVVDNRVVSMQFDNSNFERNVSHTMSTLDKFKAKLKFDKAADGLENINKAAKKVRFESLVNGIDTVKVKMGALDTFCFTAFQRISNAAITTGKNIVKAFTIDPVKTGLEEYETQINAVQTILSNTSWKGTTISEVNAALNELNRYADLTIYNFTEMTRNIGTFTAAGLDLDTSVKGIQGIANLAAVSGSNAQQASTAMYQLSQALSAGSVHLQDWNSVVNAGMGGKVFQDAIIKTAKEMGALDKATEKAYDTGTNFRELLNAKDYGNWFSSDVLANTLAKFTKSGVVEYMSNFIGVSQDSLKELQNLGDKVGYNSKQFKKMALSVTNGDKAMAKNLKTTIEMANTATDASTKVKTFTQLKNTLMEVAQSGWTQTWQLIIGDFEDAKKLFTEASDYLSNIINDSSNKRNALVKGAMQNLAKITDWKQLEKAGVATKAFQNALIETAEANGVSVRQMIKDNGSFEKSLKEGWLNQDIIDKTLKKNEKQLTKGTLKITKGLKKYFKVADEVAKGSWGKGKQAQEALTKAGYDYSQVQTLVNGINKYGTKQFEKMCIAQAKADGVTKKHAKSILVLGKEAKKAGTPINEFVTKMNKISGRELLIDSIRQSAMAVIKPIRSMKKAWSEVFPPMTSERIYDMLDALHEFTVKVNSIDKDGSKMTRTFKGIFSAVKLVTTILGGGFKLAVKTVSNILSHFNLNILDVTATIGDYLTKATEWVEKHDAIGKAAKFAADAIVRLSNGAKKLVLDLSKLPKVQNVISKIKDGFGSLFKSDDRGTSKALAAMTSFTSKIKDVNKISLADVQKRFSDFRSKAKDGFENVGDILSNFKNKVIETTSNIKSKLGEHGILGPLLTIGSGLLIIVTMKKIGSALSAFGGIIEKITSPFESFGKLLETAKGTLKAYAFELKTEALFNIAKAIGVLAASLFILSQVKSDKLMIAAAALGIMCSALALLCGVMGKFNVQSVSKVATSMVSMSSSILILVVALKKMDKLDPNNVWRNVGIISLIMLELSALSVVTNKFGAETKSAASMILFAVSLRILINALKKLDGMNLNDVKGDLIALMGMITLLGRMSKLTTGTKFSSGAGLILMVISLRMFIKTLASLDKFDYIAMQKNLGTVITIIILFGVLLKASSKAGKNAAKAGIMILSMSLSIRIIASAIKKIAAISPEEMNTASSVIAKMLVVFGAVVALSIFAGENAAKAGVMILMMGGALVAVTACAVILSQLDGDGLKRATISIGTLITCFSLLVAASHLAEDCKSNLIIMTTAIGVLAVAIGALSFIKPEQLAATTAAMSSMMLSFSAMIASTHFSESCMKDLLVMSGVVSILAVIIGSLTQLPLQNAITASGSLSILLLSLSTAMLIISKADNISGKAIGSLYAISGVVAVLSTIIGVLAILDIGPTLEIASSLSILLVSMTAVTAVLSLIGPSCTAAVKGAAALVAVIAIIGTVMVGLGALVDTFPQLEKFLDEGITLLNGIAKGIGEFVGNIIGGIGKGMTDSLPAIGTNLSKFAKTISGVDPKTAKSAKLLASTLLSLGGAQIVNAIGAFISGDANMEDFGKQLSSFGKGIVEFSQAVSGKVDASQVKNAAEAGKSIVEVADMIPNSGGWLGNIVGNNDIEDFAPQIVYLAKGIVDFANTIRNGYIDIDQANEAADCGKNIAELASTIPSSGGWLQNLVGNKNLKQFGNQVEYLAQGIVDYGRVIKDGKLDISAMDKATSAGQKIIEIAQSIPSSGGWLQNIIGINDIDMFGSHMESLGQGIVDFSSVVQNLDDVEKVDKAKDAGVKMAELCTSLYGASRSMKHLAKATYFGKLKKNLKAFSNSISSVVDSSMANVSKKAMSKAHENAKQLLDIVSLMNKTNSANLAKLPTSQKQLSSVSINAFVKDFKSSTNRVTGTIKSVLNSAVNTIRGYYNNFSNAGSYVTEGFVTGIKNKIKQGDIYGAGKSIGDEAIKGAKESLDIHSPSRKFKNIAKNTVDGFRNFINGKGTKQVNTSTKNMMNKASKTADKTSNENSKKSIKKTNSRITTHGQVATKTAKKVTAKFISDMKHQLKKAEKQLSKVSNVDKVTKNTFSKYLKNNTKVKNIYSYAKGAITGYAKIYSKSMKKLKSETNKSSKAISSFIKRLYKQSDAYKDDQKELKNLIKTQKSYYKQKVSIIKKLSKAKTKDEAKSLKKELKDVEKNIKKSNKAIESYSKTIAKNIKKAFNELKKSIKETVKSYTDIFSVTKNTISLFDTSILDNSISSSSTTEMVSKLSESLKSSFSILDITLDTGLDILSKFSSGVEDNAESIKEAEQNLADATSELTDAQNDLSAAEKELAEAQAKSDSVFGRSERYLEKVKEAEEKVATAKKDVADATNRQAEAQANLDALKTDTSVKDMLDNMKSNIDGIEEWTKNLDILAKRGIDDGLLKHLKELGVSGSAQVATFVKMTDEELSKAGEYFQEFSNLSSQSIIDGFEDKKNAMVDWGNDINKFKDLKLDDKVKSALLSKFQEKGVDSSEYIKAILNMNEEQLAKFNEDYLETLNIPDKVANEVIAARKKIDSSVSDESKLTADDYVTTMQANLDAQKKYESNLEQLQNKVKKGIISQDFYEYLKDMGADGADVIQAFLDGSDDKLKEASKIYKESAQMSGQDYLDTLGDSLSDTKKWQENLAKISQLNIPATIKEAIIKQAISQGIDSNDILETILGFTPEQLSEFVSKYRQKLSLENNIPNDIVASYAKASNQAAKDKNSSNNKKPKTSKNSKNIVTSKIAKNSVDVFYDTFAIDSKDKSKKIGISAATEFCKSFSTNLINNNRASSFAANGLGKVFFNKTSEVTQHISRNIRTMTADNIDTISNGINNIKDRFISFAQSSPLSGLIKHVSDSKNKIQSDAESSIRLMSEMIAKVAEAGNKETVSTPTIRPVLDMSEVNAGLSNLHTVLSSNTMGVSASLAVKASRGFKTSGTSQNGGPINYNYDTSQHTIENHFNITGDNPRKIASEVSRILQNQVNRRNAIWV